MSIVRPRRLTENEQRLQLRVEPHEWALFQLCRCPGVGTESDRWEEDLAELCTRFGADRERLERASREGD